MALDPDQLRTLTTAAPAASRQEPGRADGRRPATRSNTRNHNGPGKRGR